MGTWGCGPWDNDGALDWAGDLRAQHGWGPVDDALAAAIGEGYVDLETCEQAVAAIDVVAAALGAPSGDLPDEVRAWSVEHAASLEAALVRRAREALATVLEDSEMVELWERAPGAEEWQAAMADLESRLVAAAG